MFLWGFSFSGLEVGWFFLGGLGGDVGCWFGLVLWVVRIGSGIFFGVLLVRDEGCFLELILVSVVCFFEGRVFLR